MLTRWEFAKLVCNQWPPFSWIILPLALLCVSLGGAFQLGMAFGRWKPWKRQPRDGGES